MFSDSR